MLGRMITRVELHASVDPGHGGVDCSYRIERNGEAFRVHASVFQAWPPPAPGEPGLWRHAEDLVKDRAGIEAFLDRLVAQHEVFDLRDLETEQVMLHPSFFRFRVEDATGRSNEFRYRIECGKHLDSPHAALVRDFETFFDKQRLFECFRANARPAAPAPPRAWWKFWARR
jgi:hypothetical protein